MSTQPTHKSRTTTDHLATNQSTTDLADVTIIGAGLAGLLAAVEAARRDLTVNLVEKRSHPGGRAISTNHKGFKLNQGPHAVYVGGHLNRALKQFGVGPTGAEPSQDGEAIVAGRRGRLPRGPLSMIQTRMLSAGAKPKLATALIKLERQKAADLHYVSADRWIDSITSDPEVRGLVKGIATIATYNAALELASADATVKNLQLVLNDGVLYVHGGWQKMVDELDRLVETSSRIRRTAGTATNVAAADGIWTTHIGETALRSRTVVMAAGTPATADRLFGVNIFAATAGPPVTASVLDLGLGTRPATPVLFDFDRSLYLSLHSVADGLSASRHSLVTLARYRRPDDTTSAAETEQRLTVHAKAAGIDTDQILMRRYLHEMTVAHGMPTATQGGLEGRPTVEVPNLTGAFIAGDWVGTSGLLADASAASSLEAIDGVVSHVEKSRLQTSPPEANLHV